MFLQTFTYKSLCVISLVFLLIFVNDHLAPVGVEAQKSQWSVPQRIPGNDLDAWPPILIADQNRSVHAFSSQWIGDEDGESYRAVVYNRWTLAQGWTIPIDIILSPYKEARLTDVHLDENGIFHVVFFGGDNTSANIYYSKAHAATADNTYAWSTPVVIGEKAGDPEGAVFVEDDQGTLHVIYNGKKYGNGLYGLYTDDGGQNWSDSVPIFFANSDEPNISLLQVINGEFGWLHAIWGVYSANGQGRGIYYARSKDGKDWSGSEPVLLADAQDGLGTQTPALIEYNDTLVVLYNVLAKVMMRTSIDSGKTWSDSSIIFPRHIGVNGSLSLVIDSNDELHLFFGQRIPGTPDIHGMWHSNFINGRWLEPEAIVKGTLVQDSVDNKGFDPYAARAVVSQGNIILVTWRTDPNAGPNGVWYSYKKSGAPELPFVELPSLVNSNSNTRDTDNTPNASRPSTSFVEGTPTIHMPSESITVQNSPSLAILLGSIAALLFILVVVIGYRLNRGK